MVFVSLLSQNLNAENTYSWIDTEGNTVYGSKPPQDARSLKKIKTDKFSKYSVEKNKKTTFVDSYKKKKLEKPALSTNSQNSHKLNVSNKKLKVENIKLETDQYNNVIYCSTKITNEGNIKINEVNVTFKFYDGSLIPATGSFTINPGETKEYVIPETLLPLIISKGDIPEFEDFFDKPDVIIHQK